MNIFLNERIKKKRLSLFLNEAKPPAKRNQKFGSLKTKACERTEILRKRIPNLIEIEVYHPLSYLFPINTNETTKGIRILL